jgi:hypothetical protein
MKLEGLSFRDRFDILLLKLTEGQEGQFENAKIKMQSAKLRNPDLVGMSVLIGVLFVRDCQAGRVVRRV